MLNKNALPRPKRRAAPPQAEKEIVLRDEYITLGQLLKVADIISSGGEAKPYLAEVAVLVNGEPEQRRGRKLRPGDLILAAGETPVRLIAPSEPADPPIVNVESKEMNTRQKHKAAFANDIVGVGTGYGAQEDAAKAHQPQETSH